VSSGGQLVAILQLIMGLDVRIEASIV